MATALTSSRAKHREQRRRNNLGCSVDYEPHSGSVELEDHEMFKSGGRVSQMTAIVWGWTVVEDQD